ncbi:MAG: hypothetical protein UV20_C0043G0003 [Candidatus Magasanikbacteria bacterium GW2011_GWA2_42_32]|uniref:Uncharacterized protein n=1 Tax=Candidatus Magasanikbacteria bacterium GW2011_GWA2_42_32 TaxID=1619039 RepID=A0A0G1C5P0_9BACT|nr:MAG: hypothetical protein UV20_C0043G0003 [Candidatus Magasanikbacteria bacterium GW2011_GWA2_42_32]
MSKMTLSQLDELRDQMKAGRVTRENMQAFLRNPNRFFSSGLLPTSYDQSIGLVALIERAAGPSNLKNINRDITQERFKLAGSCVRTVNLRVEPYLNFETSEQAALRLVAAGRTLANTGDLAGFLHDHPEEVEKWKWVLVISEDSRWARSDVPIYVPFASVRGEARFFLLHRFRYHLFSTGGVLVCD